MSVRKIATIVLVLLVTVLAIGQLLGLIPMPPKLLAAQLVALSIGVLLLIPGPNSA